MEFYATIAQVIPVFVLALLLDVRLMDQVREFTGSWHATVTRAGLLLALLLSLVGEVVCLLVLATGETNDLRGALAFAGVVAPMFLVFGHLAVEVVVGHWLDRPRNSVK